MFPPTTGGRFDRADIARLLRSYEARKTHIKSEASFALARQFGRRRVKWNRGGFSRFVATVRKSMPGVADGGKRLSSNIRGSVMATVRLPIILRTVGKS